MKRVVIFDFNRTLYNPETGCLLPGAKFVLRTFVRRGFRLVLISRAEKNRKTLIKKLGLMPYFTKILVCRRKGLADFKKIIGKKKIAPKSGFVIGDRVKKEIAVGNRLGLSTIWLRQGKFANERPTNKGERPQFTVKNLRSLLKIIR